MADGISFHLKGVRWPLGPGGATWWFAFTGRRVPVLVRSGRILESLLQLNAMLSEEPSIALAEAMLSAETPNMRSGHVSDLSHHRDYFPAYALAGFALASLGKNDDAAVVFAEGCVWALPMFPVGHGNGNMRTLLPASSPSYLYSNRSFSLCHIVQIGHHYCSIWNVLAHPSSGVCEWRIGPRVCVLWCWRFGQRDCGTAQGSAQCDPSAGPVCCGRGRGGGRYQGTD